MATLKQRLNYKNSSGTYDTVYLETDASIVKFTAGSSYGSGTIGAAVNNLINIPDDSNSSNKYHLGINDGQLYIRPV